MESFERGGEIVNRMRKRTAKVELREGGGKVVNRLVETTIKFQVGEGGGEMVERVVETHCAAKKEMGERMWKVV